MISRSRTLLKPALLSICLILAGGLAYTQEPLFFAHQYYLPGLARSGWGLLAEDWLARTPDPFPLFSLLVRGTVAVTPFLFYLYHAILVGIYFLSMLIIVDRVVLRPQSGERTTHSFRTLLLPVALGLLFLHSLLFDEWTRGLGDVLYSGVANYYLLGPIFQPAMFGVLLLSSLALFVSDRPRTASALAGIVPLLHPTYALASSCIIAAYVLIIERETHSLRRALVVGVWGAAFLLPAVILTSLTLARPTTAAAMAQARDILVHFRVPHHTTTAALSHTGERILYTLLALFLIRKTRLFPVVALLSLAAISLTLVQLVIDSNTLALLSPWRLSALIVPLDTAVIAAWTWKWMVRKWGERLLVPAACTVGSILVLAAVIAGAARMRPFLDPHYNPKTNAYRALATFVSDHKKSGDVYLIPPKRKEMYFFRLVTGAPIFVDFKEHPFRDIDVLEWYRRIQLITPFYEGKMAPCPFLATIAKEGVTHVITGSGELPRPLECKGWEKVFGNGSYAVFTHR